MQKQAVSKKASRDVHFEEFDFEKHSLNGMQRVFNYGICNDQVAVMQSYGLKRIKNEITEANYLSPAVIGLLSTICTCKKTTSHVAPKYSPTLCPGLIKKNCIIKTTGLIRIGRRY